MFRDRRRVRERSASASSTRKALLFAHWFVREFYRRRSARLREDEEVPAWSPRLRSRTRLAGAAKRHFVDPSLAAHLMGADAPRLRSDLETMGFLFESLVTRDVRVYAQAMGAAVFHYRDRDGALEIDLVVEKPDGTWMDIEVKLGDSRADDAAATFARSRSGGWRALRMRS